MGIQKLLSVSSSLLSSYANPVIRLTTSQDPKRPQEGKDTQLAACQASKKGDEPQVGDLIITLAKG